MARKMVTKRYSRPQGGGGNGGAPVRPSGPIPVEMADHRSTAERLLDAAEQLFAERGFADTSVRDLTAAADCNIASVNYHFGSKENLYVEMFRRALTEMREHRLAAITSAMTAPKPTIDSIVRAFADSFIEPIINHPQRGDHLIQLYTREMAQPLLPADLCQREMFEPVVALMRQAVEKIRPGIDPAQFTLIVLSIVGQLIHMVQMMRLHQQNDMNFMEKIDLHQAVDHIVAFSAAGITGTTQSKGTR